MTKKCNLILDSEIYYPGQTITGRVECSFLKSQKKIKGIYITLKGQAKTYWSEDDDSYRGNEEYFNTCLNLLQGDEILLQPGNYVYKFALNLPPYSPSTIKRTYGHIKYYIKATIDLPWQLNLEDEKKFIVGSYLDLNTLESVKYPINEIAEKQVHSMFSEEGSLAIKVQLPISGFVPSQTLSFTVNVKNMSSVKTLGLHFKIIQIFEYCAHTRKRREELVLVKTVAVEDSAVACGTEKSWNLYLEIPSDTCVPNLTCCNIIKMFCELRGKVILPFPHLDLKIKIPFSLGTVAIEKPKMLEPQTK